MPKSPDTTNAGFTLIEILVVLVIIGTTLGFALLAFGDFGSQRRVIMAAEQFANYVKLAQQEAIIETSTLGIAIGTYTYQLLRFQTRWESIPNKNIFMIKSFPKDAVVRLEQSTQRGQPQIIIHATGDITAFTLYFDSMKKNHIISVIGTPNGIISVKKGVEE